MIKNKAVSNSLFVLLITFICHFLFSRFGFNPTDEGFVLSASNRVLHGLIPHVDFSSVRPLGYAYLHIPELLISPGYIFLVSRFIFWLEQALIAFLWIRFLERYLTRNHLSMDLFSEKNNYAARYMLVIITFIFNVHYFPCSVLHTIDGLLFCLIGFNIIIVSNSRYSFIGFFFIGFAALCKQNYLIVLPAALLLFGRKRILLNMFSGAFPLLFYFLFIVLHGGWKDLSVQLTGHNELFQVGILHYVFNYAFILGILLAIIVKKSRLHPAIYISVILLILCMLMLTDHYHGKWVFLLPGILLTELFYTEKIYRKLILTSLLLAWSVSISVGYNTPALFSGGCLALILLLHREPLNYGSKTNYSTIFLLLAVFYLTRTGNIYRDARSSQLTYKLNGIVDGANGIYTNKNTFTVLQELDSLKKAHSDLVVLPDFTACNIRHSHQSQILTEWPNKTEIPNAGILEKVVSGINKNNPPVFAISKYETALLKDGFTEIPDQGMKYPIIQYIKSHYAKYGESSYFDLYK